jgi:transposase InsO family protein
MEQVHRRFTTEHVRNLFPGYSSGLLDRAAVEEVLGIGKTRFFGLLKLYRKDPENFTLAYQRSTPGKLSEEVEEEIETALLLDKSLIEDRDLPITTYNYSAIRDRLLKKGIKVSVPTIINRAKALGCHKGRPKKKIHDREVLTTAIGALIQHDASHHLWSPCAQEKWVLISSLDDYSRKLLYADFFKAETTWAHIRAMEALICRHGLPLRYYVDSLRVFRFVQYRDSFWKKLNLRTDEADPQWKQLLQSLGVEITYALSPQAEGKIERSYRWLQDRIVRTSALEKLSSIEEVRQVLQEKIHRYNHLQVHSTTGEIPDYRFDKARKAGQTLFRPFILPKPYRSSKDVFCLKETRVVNPYRRLTFHQEEIPLRHVPPGEEVEIHLIPNIDRETIELRKRGSGPKGFRGVQNYPKSDRPLLRGWR